MSVKSEPIPNGTITDPQGFLAGAICAGIKTGNKLDLGIIYSETPCTAAGLFTSNAIKAPAVILSQKHLANNKAQAIVVNSGCANACIGEQGVNDTDEMARLTAEKLKVPFEDVLVASTGIIGTPLPINNVRMGIRKISLSPQGGHEVAEAILTTDTQTKEIAVNFEVNGGQATIGGIAKGSGMICPNLATMLCFLTTDAVVDGEFLQETLRSSVGSSLNMLNIDNDTSTNDMVILLANGTRGNEIIRANTIGGEAFQQALSEVCLFLTKKIARDAEGATKLIEVAVEGAMTVADAKAAARTIVGSPLVKAMIHGSVPNWGRILAALGRSKAEVVVSKIDLYLADVCLIKAGRPMLFDLDELRVKLDNDEVLIRVCLNMGNRTATAWGCDLSEEYVTINSNLIT